MNGRVFGCLFFAVAVLSLLIYSVFRMGVAMHLIGG